jgi:hypothetical protein
MAWNPTVPTFKPWNDFRDNPAQQHHYTNEGIEAKRSQVIYSVTLSINAVAKMRHKA